MPLSKRKRLGRRLLLSLLAALGAGPGVSQRPSAGLTVETRLNPHDGQRYVWIPPGTFLMGCSRGDDVCKEDEEPVHPATITRRFWLGETEATVAAYRIYAKQEHMDLPDQPRGDRHPVVFVSWLEARSYCEWIGGRLPTEAEWEYAARAGTSTMTYGPLEDIAWYHDNAGDGIDTTRPVGLKKPNAFGLYDMIGNVWERVADWYDENYYQTSPARDPKGPAAGRYRVFRGAAHIKYPRFPRVSERGQAVPEDRDLAIGFRCVWNAAAPLPGKGN